MEKIKMDDQLLLAIAIILGMVFFLPKLNRSIHEHKDQIQDAADIASIFGSIILGAIVITILLGIFYGLFS